MKRLSTEHITYAGIVKTVAAVTVFALFVHAAAFAVFKMFRKTAKTTPLEKETLHKPQGPILESATGRELAELRRKEQILLNSYGWTDRSRGYIRIPIDRAIELESREHRRQHD